MRRAFTMALMLVALLAVGARFSSCERDKSDKPGATAPTTSGTATDTGTQVNEDPPKVDADLIAIAKSFTLDRAQAQADLAELTKEAHPFGSARQGQLLDWLVKRLTDLGVKAAKDPFTAKTPNPAAQTAAGMNAPLTLDISGANVIGLDALKPDGSCVVAFGTHVDTKIVPTTSYVGANDGASSTAAVLALLGWLKASKPKLETSCDLVGFFFDGEEAVLFGWTDGQNRHPAQIRDNTYGSRSLAARLTPCTIGAKDARCLPAELGGKPLVALVLLDMVGSPQIAITRDAYSTPSLIKLAASAAAGIGQAAVYDGADEAHGIADDHGPFLAVGVPSLDLIDFNHLDHWHREGDVIETLSLDSIETASRIALYVALTVAKDPMTYAGTGRAAEGL